MPSSNKKEVPQTLGRFLTYKFWKQAIRLLDFQLMIKKTNKSFCTLNLFYFDQLPPDERAVIEGKKYFKRRVSSNLFYGLQDEFVTWYYTIPKSNLGLRRYTFATYPLRIVHYAVVLYLARISQELCKEIHPQSKRIMSEYGGNLIFNLQNEGLILNYDAVWYKNHYRRFRRQIRKLVDDDLDNKVVIRLDIQNYFDEVSIPILLEYLARHVRPSVRKEFNFDEVTRCQISNFYEYLAGGRIGIPQADNDIASAFLGHLFLIFGDLKLDDLLSQQFELKIKHEIVRYMDDIYIVISFNPSASKFQRENYISEIGSLIADMFYQELGLRLNSKTRIYWLDQEKQVKDLLRNLKRVSHGYELPDDDEKYDPKRIIELIISQLEKLKKRSLDPTFDDRSDVDDEILKQIYDDAVSNLLKKDETLLRLKDVFRDFNFDLVAAQPRELIIILLHDPDASVAFEEFLLSKFQLHSRDVNLVMTYLNQTNYQSAVLINKLATSSAMTEVMKVFQINKINSDVPGYFQVSGAQVERIVKFPHVINQAYQRVVCEQRKDYSVALNHLLNEIHAIVYKLADSASTATLNESSFKVNNVIDFLLTKNVPTSTLIQIRNLFDRRNKNPVSHADQLAWPVSRNEYFEYKLHVGACLRKIL